MRALPLAQICAQIHVASLLQDSAATEVPARVLASLLQRMGNTVEMFEVDGEERFLIAGASRVLRASNADKRRDS